MGKQYRFLDGIHQLRDEDGAARCPSCGGALRVAKPGSTERVDKAAQDRAEARRDASREEYIRRTSTAWRMGA